MVKYPFFILIASLIATSNMAMLTSCQFTAASRDSSIDSVNQALNDTIEKEQKAPVLLVDQLDSLRKNLITFPPLDSLNKVDPKVAKKKMRDSLYNELRKKPKHIYLTFDDGPLIGSAAIDSIATAKGIKISTFVIAKHVKMNKKLERDFQKYLANPLVEVYNHSYNHAFHRYQSFYSNPTTAFADFVRAQTDLGLTHKVIRLPGRNIWMYDDVKRVEGGNGRSTAQMLLDSGYRVFGWDVEWRMNGYTATPVQTVDQTISSMKSFMDNFYSVTPNNVVLLMHDDMFQKPKGQAMLGELIDKLKAEGYLFEFLTSYPIKY